MGKNYGIRVIETVADGFSLLQPTVLNVFLKILEEK